ncbi:glycosyltransferase family 2 protein [Nonomuraea antimicrobica]
MTIDVILPCLNEEAALGWVLGRMPDGYRPVVVDNGSTDRSARIARACGAKVVHEPRRGFGAACHAGLLASSAELVCFMDADASLDPIQLPRVSAAVLGGRADLVLGRRVPRTPGPGPRTPGSATPCSPGACAAVRVRRCTTWAPCGRPGARPCWASG